VSNTTRTSDNNQNSDANSLHEIVDQGFQPSRFIGSCSRILVHGECLSYPREGCGAITCEMSTSATGKQVNGTHLAIYQGLHPNACTTHGP
jgi:hypothetical protein